MERLRAVVRRLSTFHLEEATRRLWRERFRSQRSALVAGLVLNWLAYGFYASSFVLTGDDWFGLWPDRLDDVYDVGSGRWLMRAIWLLLEDNTYMPFLRLMLAAGINLATGLLLCSLWKIRSSFAASLVIGLVTTQPFLADTMVSKMLPLPFAHLLAVTSAWLAFADDGAGDSPRTRSWGWAAVAFALACAAYLPAATTAAVAALGRVFVELADRPATIRREELLRGGAARFLVSVAAGLVLYAASVSIAWTLTGSGPHTSLQDGRYDLTSHYVSSPGELLLNLQRVFGLASAFLLAPQTLFPVYLKQLYLLGAGCATLALLLRLRSERSLRAAIPIALLAIVLACWIAPFFVVLIRSDTEIRHNALFSLGVLYALTFAVAARYARAPLLRSLIFVSGFGIVLGFIYQQNVAALGIHLINQRDIGLANRMLERIESHPGYAKLPRQRGLAIVGSLDYRSGRPFGPRRYESPFPDSIVSCSVFECQTSRSEKLFQLLQSDRSTYDARIALRKWEEVKRLAAGRPSWPQPGSIVIANDLVVVILSNSHLQQTRGAREAPDGAARAH